MALTDIQLRNAKPAVKDYSITDGQGLSIQITKSGGKWWRFRYRFIGKPKLMSFGTYPEVSLADARDRRVSRILCNPQFYLKLKFRTAFRTKALYCKTLGDGHTENHSRPINCYNNTACHTHHNKVDVSHYFQTNNFLQQ